MKDNKKKKDRRKYPQGSAASHAGQNSGNHGGHAGHPRSRSSKLLKNRKTLLMDLVSSKNYEPMRLKDIAMLLQVPKAKRSELAEVMEILVKEGKIDVISDGRYQKSRGASTTTENREKRDRRAGEQGRRGRDDRFRRKNGKDGDTEKKPRIQTVDIQAVVDAYQIPEEFPARVITQAEKCPEEVIPNDYNGRLDLKSWQMVTIDGEDAKDLDDAVSVTKAGDTWTLGVHIADVSNYVQENSALDREALKRGTSVYLPDRVIPMLPKRLSNGICSLNEGQERLALSCIMTINEKGRVIGHQIAETVIRVDRRMTYTAVNAILTEPEAHPELLEEYHELVPMFRQMQELFYGKRYSATCLRRRPSCPGGCKGPNDQCPEYVPDFVKLAESYGAYGIRVEKEEDIDAAFAEAKKHTDAPTIIEFMIATDELVLPMVKSGNPMSEMILK